MLMASTPGCLTGIVCTLTAMLSGPAQGQCDAAETLKLLSAAPPTEFSAFGRSVALDGAFVAIGSPNSGPGDAFVFHDDGSSWVEQQHLIGDDSDDDDAFGWSVDIDGDVIVIGAPGSDPNQAGAVYVFRHNNGLWTQEAKVLPPAPLAADDRFGESVAVDGNVLVVGAAILFPAGEAYVYRFDGETWHHEQTLGPTAGAFVDAFGASVDIRGGLIAVGARTDSSMASFAGAVYFFRFNQQSFDWDLEDKIFASDASEQAQFGWSVALADQAAIIGAHDNVNTSQGAAYVFRPEMGAWTEETKLTHPPGGPANDGFGVSVAIDGEVAIVGSDEDDQNGSNAGAAFVYTYDGVWSLAAKLVSSDGAPSDYLGRSVVIQAGTAFAGAPSDLPAGSAHCFDGLADCNTNEVLDICDIAWGGSEDANSDGIPDECATGACPWDMDGSGDVDTVDFLTLLAQWGTNPGGPPDFDESGSVDTVDFLALLSAWGGCP